jgi:hypothetical protein
MTKSIFPLGISDGLIARMRKPRGSAIDEQAAPRSQQFSWSRELQ